MTEAWAAPAANRAVDTTVEVPGSKSMTNRALVLAALADSSGVLHDPLFARDTELMVAGLAALGTGIDLSRGRIHVEPSVLRGPAAIDCGLAGTVLRFLPPVACLAVGEITFDGDARARSRPLGPLLGALSDLGAQVHGTGLPFSIRGIGCLDGGAVALDASASSQFVSGLLLSGARMDAGVRVIHRGGTLPSQPHIDMTVQMLLQAGARVTSHGHEWTVEPGPIRGCQWHIEPDLSNAGPFLAAAMVTGGTVRIPRWPASTTQAGDAWRDILTALGASVALTADGLTVTGSGSWRGVNLDLREIGELTPTIAALAALADSPSRLTGIGHLRGHETDRLAAIAAELTKIGVAVGVEEDGLQIDPRGRRTSCDTVLDSYADHRMATMAAILALAVPGVRVADPETTSKTLPGFVRLWEDMLA